MGYFMVGAAIAIVNRASLTSLTQHLRRLTVPKVRDEGAISDAHRRQQKSSGATV
jgi:hypothetical protein